MSPSCRSLIALLLIASSFPLFAAEPDILGLIRNDPARATLPSGVVEREDRTLAAAVEALADIPRPWTVPKMLDEFDKTLWPPDAPGRYEEDWVRTKDRLIRLIHLLGRSRDPRAALALIEATKYPNWDVKISAFTVLESNLVEDPQYHPLPPLPDKGMIRITNNVFRETQERVHEWWRLNEGIVRQKAESAK